MVRTIRLYVREAFFLLLKAYPTNARAPRHVLYICANTQFYSLYTSTRNASKSEEATYKFIMFSLLFTSIPHLHIPQHESFILYITVAVGEMLFFSFAINLLLSFSSKLQKKKSQTTCPSLCHLKKLLWGMVVGAYFHWSPFFYIRFDLFRF